MQTPDAKIDYWFYAQLKVIHMDVVDTLEELIEWDQHRRIHLLAFRSPEAETAYQACVFNTYSTLKALANIVNQSRGLIAFRWLALLKEVEQDVEKYAPAVELATSPF